MFERLLAGGGLTLERLRTFCLVADAGGVTKAARGNRNQQSQYSRQINDLEEFFGVDLMARDSKGVRLTPSGRTLLSVGHDVLTLLNDFKSECEQQPHCFSIGAGDALLQWLVFPQVGQLQKALPNISIEVHGLATVEIAERVDDGRLDFGLIRKDALHKGQKSQNIGWEDYALFVPKALLPKGRSPSLKDVIAKVPLTTIAGQGRFRATLEKQARKNGIPLKFALCCSTFPQAVRALRSERFAAIVPTIAADDLDISRYVRLSVPFLDGREIFLVWNERRIKVRPKMASVRDCLVKHLKLPKRDRDD